MSSFDGSDLDLQVRNLPRVAWLDQIGSTRLDELAATADVMLHRLHL